MMEINTHSAVCKLTQTPKWTLKRNWKWKQLWKWKWKLIIHGQHGHEHGHGHGIGELLLSM
jgi:hypothetical protein